MTEGVVVSAFYKFITIPAGRLDEVRSALETCAASTGLKGLVVMGSEGLNATVAGSAEAMVSLRSVLAELFPNEEFTCKESRAEKPPFARFKVDLRPEIITTKDLSLSSQESEGTHLSPKEWHEMIATDPDVVVVDTRNDYETEVGVFQGAIDPKIKKFSDFQGYLETHALPKDKKLLLYCTGGIRCEKAVPEVKRLGYDKVYQLQGGILKYLEEYPDGHFRGECFVFDHRVAVDASLQPSKVFRLCPHCGNPAKVDSTVVCGTCGTTAVVCPRCQEREDRKTCSKNCAHHARLRSERESAHSKNHTGSAS
jgi:UPF0176 protein